MGRVGGAPAAALTGGVDRGGSGVGAARCRGRRSRRWIPIVQGLRPAQYDRIRAPALGIFNRFTPQYRVAFYWRLGPAQQKEFDRDIRPLATWAGAAIERFRAGVKNARVVELHDVNHYLFIVDEALVVREMRRFLLGE